jgi:hypothetical protein
MKTEKEHILSGWKAVKRESKEVRYWNLALALLLTIHYLVTTFTNEYLKPSLEKINSAPHEPTRWQHIGLLRLVDIVCIHLCGKDSHGFSFWNDDMQFSLYIVSDIYKVG